jgi:hypothetical protein
VPSRHDCIACFEKQRTLRDDRQHQLARPLAWPDLAVADMNLHVVPV